MKIFKMAGYCLILLGIINVLHEINLRATGLREPGIGYALVTAVFFTAGAALLWRSKIKPEKLPPLKQ